jgi:hypothetical protein
MKSITFMPSTNKGFDAMAKIVFSVLVCLHISHLSSVFVIKIYT